MLRIFFSLLMAVSLSACTDTGHKLAAISSTELSKASQEISTKKVVLKTYNRSDAQNRALISRASNRLQAKVRPLCDHTGYKSCKFQTIYDPGDTVNAYAYENYKIKVFKGLMDQLQTEDEVAFVIAHEMGHHLANHNQEKAQNAAVGAAVTGILTAAILGAASNNTYYTAQQQQNNQRIVTDMMNTGAEIGALSYSKEEEREADLLGQYLMARTGYDMRKAERVMWVLLEAA